MTHGKEGDVRRKPAFFQIKFLNLANGGTKDVMIIIIDISQRVLG